MKNTAQDLRNHLFAQLEALRDAKSPEEVEREVKKAKAVNDTSKQLVDLAKVEINAHAELGTRVTGSMPFLDPKPALPAPK